mgnify:CR=1 FL=1
MQKTGIRVRDTKTKQFFQFVAKPLDSARIDLIFVQINVEDEVQPPLDLCLWLKYEHENG